MTRTRAIELGKPKVHEVKFGELCDDDARRDAVHVAVAPVTAAQILAPGEHIGWADETRRTVARVADPFGIIDPYLRVSVMPGQRCWVFLYPQTVTGMRHAWSHPAFSDVEPDVSAETVSDSEAWLRAFCCNSNCPSYENVMRAISSDGYDADGDYSYARVNDDYLHFGGLDAHGEIPDEFWFHAERVLGRTLARKPKRFSCSC